MSFAVRTGKGNRDGTMAMHDDMKGLVHAVCVHGLAWKGAFPMFSCHFGHGEDAETAAS